jgi:hypothetical protein
MTISLRDQMENVEITDKIKYQLLNEMSVLVK